MSLSTVCNLEDGLYVTTGNSINAEKYRFILAHGVAGPIKCHRQPLISCRGRNGMRIPGGYRLASRQILLLACCLTVCVALCFPECMSANSLSCYHIFKKTKGAGMERGCYFGNIVHPSYTVHLCHMNQYLHHMQLTVGTMTIANPSETCHNTSPIEISESCTRGQKTYSLHKYVCF